MTTAASVACVVGSGGLLGSAVATAARRHYRRVIALTSLRWRDPADAGAAVEMTIRDLVDVPHDGRLVIFWCAGAGRVGTPATDLATETLLLQIVLDGLRARARAFERVTFCLASSGGGVWSGAPENLLDEDVPPRPWHDYGRAKVAQEQLLVSAAKGGAVQGVVARISNLYGCPPNGKRLTGLVNNLALNALRRRPTGIYVPLDTQRDYITARAAADLLLEISNSASHLGTATDVRTHVVAAGRSHTIGQLADVLGRVLGRPVPLTVGYSSTAAVQPRALAFRSTHLDLAGRAPHLAHEVDTLIRDLFSWRP